MSDMKTVTTHEWAMNEYLVCTRDVPATHVNVRGQAMYSRTAVDMWLPEGVAVALLGECDWLRSKTHNAFGAKFSLRGKS